MDKSLIDKYIEELRTMHSMISSKDKKAAEPVPLETENQEDMTGDGGLVVMVTAVRGLYPVASAKVTVFTGNVKNMNIIAEAYTNDSGKTPLIKLPSVASTESEAPSSNKRPFAYYNIKTTADGYIDTVNYNLAVFDGVTSVQNISLYPLASRPKDSGPIVIDEFENYEL